MTLCSTGLPDRGCSEWCAEKTSSAEFHESLPTLLHSIYKGFSKPHLGDSEAADISTVSFDRYLPDFEKKLGAGAYGQVYPVVGMPDKVVKIFRRNDWMEVVKESSFARCMKARDPSHYVDCLGIGSTSSAADCTDHFFAVFERAPGITLGDAAYRFHHPCGILHISQALDVLDQLLSIINDMMMPDAKGLLQIHLDLKPQNIMVSTSPDGLLKVALIDYGLVEACSAGGSEAKDAALQLFRWVGWEFLWILASEAFCLSGRDDQGPWEQLPEGFRPFFRRSDFRPPAYQTDRLSPGVLQSALQEDFFSQVLSPPFRKLWVNPSQAKQELGRILGELFYGVALASDRLDFEPDFDACHRQIQSLRSLVVSGNAAAT